jgi:hypothetical protein
VQMFYKDATAAAYSIESLVPSSAIAS